MQHQEDGLFVVRRDMDIGFDSRPAKLSREISAGRIEHAGMMSVPTPMNRGQRRAEQFGADLADNGILGIVHVPPSRGVTDCRMRILGRVRKPNKCG